jgi:threonyl-tRNA synthetase
MHSSFPNILKAHQSIAAELLAFTVSELFPNVVLAGGGTNSLGFYYDFIFEQPLTEGVIELIELKLHTLVKEGRELRYISMMRENAQNLFQHQGHFLLAECVAAESSNILELVQIDEFYDLCPHSTLSSTDEVGHIKILDWNELKEDVQSHEKATIRFTGVARQSAKDLKVFLKKYELFLKKRDHRVLGTQLNLFSFSEKMGAFGVIWHPKGMELRRFLQKWLEDQSPDVLKTISTPLAVQQDFLGPSPLELNPFNVEGKDYTLRPSLLEQHLEFLKHYSFDLENLPFQVMEYSPVYRQYPESQRWGLFCQGSPFIDQTTIVCLKKQVVPILISSLHFIEQIIRLFDFEGQWRLIVSRQRKGNGWRDDEVIEWLKEAIQTGSGRYPFDPEVHEEEGEGPHLELCIRDSLGREWAASQLGPFFPFKVQDKEQPLLCVLTRHIWGCLDRFIGLLIEQFEGVLPLWLAPEQVRILVIGEPNRAYAKEVAHQLQQNGLRVSIDIRSAKLSMRIHEAEKENIPFLILIGEQERVNQKVNVRSTGKVNRNQKVDLLDVETFLKIFASRDAKKRNLTGERKSA